MGHFSPRVIYRDPNEERKNSIIRYIVHRVLDPKKKQNFLCGITGAVGNGKSYLGISLCEMYSKLSGINFDPKIHIITSLKDLLLLINHKNRDKILPKGSCLLFDEPQVEANARKWQSEINLAFSQLISTFRNRRLVCFFALPYLNMIDKQSRIIFQGEFRVEGFDINNNLTHVKPRFLEWNDKKQDFYVKRLLVFYKMKGKQVMNHYKLHDWYVPLASKELIDIYESKKIKFTNDLNKKLLEKLELDEKRESGRDKSDEFFKVKSLYDKFGEDYEKILKQMPHLSAFAIDKYIQFIKRSKKNKKREDSPHD